MDDSIACSDVCLRERDVISCQVNGVVNNTDQQTYIEEGPNISTLGEGGGVLYRGCDVG